MVALLTACTPEAAPERAAVRPSPTVAAPEPTATTPTPTPTPWPKPTPAPPRPIEVSVERLDTELLDNAALRGGQARPFEAPAVLAAAEGVRVALERYLNAQFVNPRTRFGPEPVEALVAGGPAAALPADQRRALGVLDVDVDNVRARPVAADVLVLVDGSDVLTAAASYTAEVTIEGPSGRNLLTQEATLVFASTPDGWRAEAVDVSLQERW